MKKIFFLFLIFIIIALGIYFPRLGEKNDLNPTSSPTPTIQEKVQLPVTLTIPSISVKADVEYVGMDPKGNMDVPKKSEDVAWYNLGNKPGEEGSAVIAGHLDDVTGAPAVFWNISKLKKNDKIYVTDSKGNNFTFNVIKIANYDSDNFPLRRVFADNSGIYLNLITCAGTWDKNSKSYTERTVVFSKLNK